MKKLPRKVKQWANEAFESLSKATALSSDEPPNPEYDEVLSLFSYCVPLAAMNRGIDGAIKLKKPIVLWWGGWRQTLKQSSQASLLIAVFTFYSDISMHIFHSAFSVSAK